ncbi:MAG: geranylgeranylglycerol-phosphate geranylgeranyltransferase [Flavobacterium sp.]
MMNRKTKWFLWKLASMFSVIRGYNIPVIILAQYLAAIFIFSEEHAPKKILLDFHLFLLVVASTLTIASGYIINNFYDAPKDWINRPKKSMLDRLVSQKTKLYVYFTINVLVVMIAMAISWRAVLFFSAYIFFIWFYSHKVKKYPIVGNILATLLAITPFFAILLYYKNFYGVVFAHAFYLFLLLWIKEIIKDLENLPGDLTQNYRTIPVVYGENKAKQVVYLLTTITLIPLYLLIEVEDVGYMDLYFYLSSMALMLLTYRLYFAKDKAHYLWLHNWLKVVIVGGVFSIILIKPEVFSIWWNRI